MCNPSARIIPKARAADAHELNRQGRLPLLMPGRWPLLKRLAHTPPRHPAPVGAVSGQLTALPALEAGRRACVAPRWAFNIFLAGEVGLRRDLHGHAPAGATRAGHRSMGTERRGRPRRSSHP